MNTVADRIKHLNPCRESLEWAAEYTSVLKAWKECPRGDWMLWILGKQAGELWVEGRKKLVLAACACARLALPHTKDERVLKCIETAEKWTRGEATQEEVEAARCVAAAAAADAAYAAAADAAAYAAAYAAYAAAAAAAAAAYAAYAAAADAAAYAAYAAADARVEVLAQYADEVRKIYPRPPKVKE